MDQVDFEPAQHWSATVLRGVDHQPESKQPMRLTNRFFLFYNGNCCFILVLNVDVITSWC